MFADCRSERRLFVHFAVSSSRVSKLRASTPTRSRPSTGNENEALRRVLVGKWISRACMRPHVRPDGVLQGPGAADFNSGPPSVACSRFCGSYYPLWELAYSAIVHLCVLLSGCTSCRQLFRQIRTKLSETLRKRLPNCKSNLTNHR